MRVVVADDSLLTREGIVRLLGDAAVEVVGQAEDANGLLREVRSTAPDAAVVDIRMPPTHTDEGLVAAQRIRTEHPTVAVLVLSHHIAPSYAMQLLDDYPERVGYLLKERVFDAAVLVDALRRITDGETVVDPTIVARLVRRPRAAGPLDRLTERERDVLGLVAEGLSNRAIATRLVVAERTVETHVSHVFSKLGLTDDPAKHGASRPCSPTCAAQPETRPRTHPAEGRHRSVRTTTQTACRDSRASPDAPRAVRVHRRGGASSPGPPAATARPPTGRSGPEVPTMPANDDSSGPGDVRGPADRLDRRRSTATVVQEAQDARLAVLPPTGPGAVAPNAGGRRSPWRRRAVVLATASLTVLSACSTPQDVAAPDDEAAAAPVVDATSRTLRLAHIDGGTALDPPVDWFIEQVDAVSDGALTIELVTDCCGADPDVEEQLVAKVASGEFDLGWVGTRVFEGLGVNDFAALTAPTLLDSYAVQQAVLASDIPQQMLDGLDAVGVEGIAALPGSLRLPLAVEEPLLAPADWQGVTFHTVRSAGNATTISALGATPVDVGFAARNAGLVDGSIQGLENSVIFHTQAAFDLAPYVTLNVRLWPRVSALIMDPVVLSELDDTELGWLRQAAANVVGRTRELAELDAAAVADGCAKGGRYALANDAELAETSEALESVITELRQNGTTGEVIERIQELAESISAEQPPVVPEGCATDEPAAAVADEEPEAWDGPTIPDGTYEKMVTREEAVAAGVPVSFLDQPDEFLGIDEFHITILFQDGRYQFLANYVGGTQVGDRGTYTYDADGRLVRTSTSSGCPGCTSVCDWSFADDTLVLEVSEDAGDYPDSSEADRAITRVYDAGTFQKTG